MSGHSHWATIKRAKGAADAKKGKIFSKLGKEITIVVKAKGGNPDNNPTLRTLIAKAKAAQMPNDNIDRAIKKGTGELESAALVDAVYEGIKGGIAIVCTVLTDNKNRAAAEVSNVFKKNGTELAKQGSAARLFDRMGQIIIPAADGVTEDKVMEAALEAGAEDVISEADGFTVKCQCADYTTVLEAIKAAGIAVETAHIEKMASSDAVALAALAKMRHILASSRPTSSSAASGRRGGRSSWTVGQLDSWTV